MNQRAYEVALAIHGGCGTISRSTITPAIEAQFRHGLEAALRAGHRLLQSGASSVDAVVAAIKVLEDDPLFNAGKGSVFTNDGRNELDAAIMNGATGLAGAIAGVGRIKNPIDAARAVMEKSRHVLLIGQGAEQFAKMQGIEMVEPSYFHTAHRWEQLQLARAKDQVELDHDTKLGTVGAVALDADGNLAAGTSTGGMTNKMFGRVGDSPIIGAGTYANNASLAVSGTGSGEFFMRSLLAYDIAARMRYTGVSLSDAVDQAIEEGLTQRQGQGGVIALDRRGMIKFGFNTEGMYRGYIKADGAAVTMVYG